MTEKNNYQGNLQYPINQNAYRIGLKEEKINPRTISGNKGTNENETVGSSSKKLFFEDALGYAPDMTGPETNRKQEDIKTRDEEIKYYSLGGDNHYDEEDASWK